MVLSHVRTRYVKALFFTISTATALASGVSAADDNLSFFHQGDVILFQGDSITDCGRTANGHPTQALGDGYVRLVAREIGQALPNRNLTFVNRGISGNRVTDLAARWRHDTINLKPNFLSILVGVNDALSTARGPVSAERFEQVYDQLLRDTWTALPKTRIVLCEPFMLPVGMDRPTFEAALTEVKKRQEVVARLSAKYRLPLVQFQKAFDDASRGAPPPHWSGDGVHPTAAGHQLMAAEWLRTIRELRE